jgi:hypothetical protein
VQGRREGRELKTRLLALLLIAVAIGGCPKKTPQPEPEPEPDAAARLDLPPAPAVVANVAHGKELVLQYQCNRCHDGTGHEAAVQAKHCVHCHKDIMEDRFTAAPASLAKWKPRVKELADAPSLESAGKRFTRPWIEQYLLQPSDLRPHLQQYMPRLAISAADARDIAAYLVPAIEPPGADPGAPPELAGADLGKGRQLLETKGCGSCHVFTGVAAIPSSSPPAMSAKDFEVGHKLAPDLRVTRARMTPAKLVRWLKDPAGVKADTKMPKIELSDGDVKNLAAYLLGAELAAPVKRAPRERLPLLTRKVVFKEVDEKVFHRTCWHCHSEPDYAIGDGGPGNSGGFGFKPRGLNLSAYEGIAAGFVDDQNERQSVFAKDKEGVPRLVRALLARSEEENGASTGEVRGMPLGYDPLSPEEIQLVDSWIAQGRPR